MLGYSWSREDYICELAKKYYRTSKNRTKIKIISNNINGLLASVIGVYMLRIYAPPMK